jgi:hypothetical protein
VGYREGIFKHGLPDKQSIRKSIKSGGQKKKEIEFTEKMLLYHNRPFLSVRSSHSLALF